jgi:exodeoxyribonuclease VII small subunit
MANTKKTSAEEKNIDFESSMQRLEEIVAVLEKGKVGIDESMELYEEAISLARKCSAVLDQAEQRVSVLRLGTDGKLVLEDFKGESND